MVRAEDVLPVRSRVSWGAIFAGSVLALAAYLIFTLLGTAIGLTVSNSARAETLQTGAAIWVIASLAIALFVGGWVTTQLTVGENKTEAVVHGVIMWGVLLAMLLWLTASGMRAGFNAMVGMANVAAAAGSNTTPEDWEAAARRAGVSQETINDWKAKAQNAPADVRRKAADPENQEALTAHAAEAAWWTLLGTVLSMAAAVGGAVAGAGPTLRIRVRRASPTVAASTGVVHEEPRRTGFPS